MYELGILLFAALLTAKTVDFARHLYKDMTKAVVVVVALVLGVGYAYLFDYSVFAGWDVAVRSEWMGTIATGLFMGSLAGAWHEALGMMREWAHRYHGEATEIEARLQRAA